MTKETNVTSGDTQENSSGNSENMVNYDSFKKVLNEKKNVQAKAKELESQLSELSQKLKDIELEKQQKDGNKDEVIAALRRELEEKRNEVAEKDRGYARTVIEGQIKAKAIETGCDDLGLFMAGLQSKGDLLTSVEVGENYQVNSDDLERVIENMKKDHPALFKKKDVNVHDVTSVNMLNKTEKKELSKEEIIAEIKRLEGF